MGILVLHLFLMEFSKEIFIYLESGDHDICSPNLLLQLVAYACT